ncbi:MAG: hypothetical protein QXG08_06250 [Candidatus Methanomethyliaceae archaeon]
MTAARFGNRRIFIAAEVVAARLLRARFCSGLWNDVLLDVGLMDGHVRIFMVTPPVFARSDLAAFLFTPAAPLHLHPHCLMRV